MLTMKIDSQNTPSVSGKKGKVNGSLRKTMSSAISKTEVRKHIWTQQDLLKDRNLSIIFERLEKDLRVEAGHKIAW